MINKLMFWLLLCAIFWGTAKSAYKPCQLREYPDGYVCVCNETYCDTMDVAKPQKFGEYVAITSTKAGQRFAVSKGRLTPTKPPPSVIRVLRSIGESINDLDSSDESVANDTELWLSPITLTINRNKHDQQMVGFGGAFTGTVSYLIDLMPLTLQHSFYRSYYAQDEGIGYTMMRIPIGGCDFDFQPWAYNETPMDDVKLANFTKLDARDLKRIAQINELKEVAKIDEIKLLGAAWSPPKWMKSNNDWTGYSYVRPEYYQTWAEYHLQYLRLMAAQNMTYWGISTGNEPLNGVIGWAFVHFMSLGWTPKNQGKWVGQHLGPLLNSSELHGVKLFVGDDQRYTYPWWFDQMRLGASNVMDFVYGFAVHWYWDRLVPPILLDRTKEKYPDKILLNSESALGDQPQQTHGPILGSWSRAERYALGMIQDFQHHVAGWIDWNLILDESGGPSYVNNTIEAAVILNTTTNNEFYKQPIFYVLGHFSKFIPSGSVRIDSNLSGFRSGQIKTVAFLCPDNTVTIVLYNQSNKMRLVEFTDDLRGSFHLQLEPKSITTFIFA